MAEAWEHWAAQGAPGVIWIDPDIVADPDDLAAMTARISYWPGAVWCSLHKLWPASTGRDDWVWAHGRWAEPVPEMTQQAMVMPGWFALGMTYTPAILLDKVAADLPCWVFGTIDMGLSAAARATGIPIRVAHECQPKHLHYLPRRGDPAWRS